MNYFDDLTSINLIKKFPSKRNSVYLTKNNIVIKKFSEREFFNKELRIYQLLEKESKNEILKYPQLIEYNEEELFIKYQYIDGETLLSNFERYEQNNDIELAISQMTLLFRWINLFQASLTKKEYIDELLSVGIYLNSEINKKQDQVVSFVDINFKNFIQKDNKLYGFDFENVNIDQRVTDYTKSLAYMMTYSPIGTKYKKYVLNNLLIFLRKKYNFSKENIYKSYNKELKKIERRRNISIDDLYLKN